MPDLPSSSPPPSPTEPALLEEQESFGDRFNDFLEELGFSRRHIFYGLGCVILIVLLVLGGFAGWRFYQARKKQIPSQPKPATQIVKEETGLPITSQLGQNFFLKPEEFGETGVTVTVALGKEKESLAGLVPSLMLFRRMQNAYETNIDELLNKATDRRSRLSSHLVLLKKLHFESTARLKKIKEEMESIRIQYEASQKTQEAADTNFFEQLNAFNAQTTQDIFDEFVRASREGVTLRAHFKALQKIQVFYESGLPKFVSRIRDIELNEEALVSGIKIYDVAGSSLQLIVPANGQEEKISDRLQTPPRSQFFPLKPFQIPENVDFITVPGGGFKDYLKPGTPTQR